MKRFLALMLLLLLPAVAIAEGSVLMMELPDDAQMVESVEFEDGEFIQTYQLADGVSVQLLRYADFEMSLEELIASDWPENCGVQMHDLAEISGYPAGYAHIWQIVDSSGYPIAPAGSELSEGQQMMEIDLIMVTVGNETLIYQDSYLSGQRGDATLPIIESLQVLPGEAAGDETAEVG